VTSPAQANALVDHFFRHEYGRLVSSLARRFGMARLSLVEDAVQSALALALTSWALRGLPANPSAWLTRVAHNQVIDQLRRLGVAQRCLPRAEVPLEPVDPDELTATENGDDELRMLFVCCHEQLPARTQLVLSLKLLCGFSTREIAARLFQSDASVQKTLSRGRARLAELCAHADLPWSEPDPERLPQRVAAVLQVLYLLFNEGYSSQREDEVIRRDLCDEALRLATRLATHPAGDVPEVWALLALFHFHRARLDARLDGRGDLLLLEAQDRSRWDRAHIHEGLMCLWRSGQGDRFSRYHAEAGVLAEHCLAPSFAQTRWSEIVELYAMLEQLEPSPLHTLNRAIALAEWKGPREGLRVLEALTPPAWLVTYYLWDATLGELLRRCGEFEPAARYLARGLERAPTAAERRILSLRLDRCRAGDSER